MILSDRSIKDALRASRIVIEPYDEGCVQPASVDLRMGRLFRVFRNHTSGTIDVKLDQADLTELIEVPEDGVFMLHPGEFVLGSTHERVAVGDDLVGCASRGRPSQRTRPSRRPMAGGRWPNWPSGTRCSPTRVSPHG